MAAKSERSDSDLEGRAGGTRVAHRSCFAVAESGPPPESVRSQRLDENYEWQATTGRRDRPPCIEVSPTLPGPLRRTDALSTTLSTRDWSVRTVQSHREGRRAG